MSPPGRPKGEYRRAQPEVAPVTISHAVTAAQIEAALQQALQPAALQVLDDSHLHAGHAGAREGRHFTVHIRCAAFAGKPRVARHRLVYDALAALFPQGIHALAIVARAPDEADSSPS